MAGRLSLPLVTKALAIVTAGAGAVSVLRALSRLGIPDRLAGEWIGEGRALVERGCHPDKARCAGANCEHELDTGVLFRPVRFVKADERRRRAAMGEGPSCPGCGGTAWIAPCDREVAFMRLALADSAVGTDMLELTGKASAKLLRADAVEDPRFAAPQVALIKHYQAALDPVRFGEKSTVRLEGGLTVAAQQGWARGIKPEDADRLSPAAVEHLRQIDDLMRSLDEEARRLVEADLAGLAYVPVLPLVGLPQLSLAATEVEPVD